MRMPSLRRKGPSPPVRALVVAVPAALILLSTFLHASEPASEQTADAPLDSLSSLLAESHYDAAIELGENWLATRPDDHAAESDDVAKLHLLLVDAYNYGGRADEDGALQHALSAIEILETRHGADAVELAPAWKKLGNLRIFRWENMAAREPYEKAIALWRGAGDADRAGIAVTLSNLGISYRRTGEYSWAAECYDEALAIQEEVRGADHPDVAGTLNNLALVRVKTAHYREARALHERALRIREAHFGASSEWVAESLANLATSLLFLGEFTSARAVDARALSILEETLGVENPRTLTVRLNRASLLNDMGAPTEARIVAEKVLEIQMRTLGPDHAELPWTLDTLAQIETDLGEHALALTHLERSLAILGRDLGEGNPALNETLMLMGSVQAALGMGAAASATLREALAAEIAGSGEDSPRLADPLLSLADLELSQADATGALADAKRAAELIESGLGVDHPKLADALLRVAKAERQLGHPGLAADAALQSEEIRRRHLRTTFRALSERRALDYAAHRRGGLDLAVLLCLESEPPTEIARVFDSVIRSRGIVLEELVTRRRHLHERPDPASDALRTRSREARERLANLTLRGPGYDPLPAYRTLLADARRDRDEAERELAESAQSTRTESDENEIGLDELRRSLPPDAALLSYVRAAVPGAAARYAAFVLPAGQEFPLAIDLGPAFEVEKLVAEWQAAAGPAANGASSNGLSRGIERQSAAPSAGDGERFQQLGRELEKRIFDRVRGLIPDAVKLFIVPDGALHRVSFAALPLDDGRYVAETELLLHGLSAERQICDPHRPAAASTRLLSVGAPDFDRERSRSPKTQTEGEAGCEELDGLRFAALPGTGRESTAVEMLWRSRGVDVQVSRLDGPEASEARFKELAADQHVLHIATHGFALERCTPPNGDRAVVSPLLLSGLAFAGANAWRSAGGGSDDGLLTAEEVAALDLSSVEWAVLSGCETGRGGIGTGGEGVFGLRRALELAGARTVVSSLWAVDDESTAEWMREFYAAHFIEGVPTAAAVRHASRRLLERYRQRGVEPLPYLWAGFHATGNWR